MQVTCDNIERVVVELAYKFVIQTPSYVIGCWKVILPQFFSSHHVDVEAVLLDMEPSAAKVIKRLSFPNDMSLCQKTVSEHLKKFIKLASKALLGAFLRFCTGEEILLKQDITVMFNGKTTKFGRTPVAHTCGMVLDLPDSYQSYMEFSTEFNPVNIFWFCKRLKGNVWQECF